MQIFIIISHFFNLIKRASIIVGANASKISIVGLSMFHQRLLASEGIRQFSCMLFPGQGAQYVGMTSKIQINPAVQSLFKRANDILGYDLQSLCLNGPEHTLRKTEYCQPAIVVSSLAAAAVHNHEVTTSAIIIIMGMPPAMAVDIMLASLKYKLFL